jgi:hypothetical protein
MFTIVLMMYLQSNLDVMLVKTQATGQYRTRAACEAAALGKRRTLPVPQGYAGAWQDAVCVAINRGVDVVSAPGSELINLPGAGAGARDCPRDTSGRRDRHAR